MMHAESTHPLESEPARCVVCEGNGWSFLREGPDLQLPDGHPSFQLSRCQTCGHIAQIPPPSDEQLRRAYSAEYAPYLPAWKEPGWPLWKILREITTWRRISRLKKHGKGKRLLEVGAGAGDFLYAAQRAGWEVKAIEYSEDLVRILREELGLDVRSGELAPGLWEEGSFDLVVFWSVLEHVRNPVATLITAAAYLRPGGAVFLQLPTRDGVEQGNWFSGEWALLDLPRHLNFFGEGSLAVLCDRVGFDLAVFKTPLTDVAWCYVMSSLNRAKHIQSLPKRYLCFATLMIIVVLSLPWLAMKAWRGHGTEAFVVAIKR